MYIYCITRIYYFSWGNPFALLQAVLVLSKPDNGQSTPAQSKLKHGTPGLQCRSLSDTATQCCFDPIVLVSVATQTDDLPTTVASHNTSNGSSLVKTQASFNVPAEEWKISDDHDYSMSVPMVYPNYGWS